MALKRTTVSIRAAILTWIASAAISYFAGTFLRPTYLHYYHEGVELTIGNAEESNKEASQKRFLPPLSVDNSKDVPQTVYSSKDFQSSQSSPSESVFMDQNCDNDERDGHCDSKQRNIIEDGEDGKDDEEEHLPAGQHLLVDIENVDREFLDSTSRLAAAMVQVVNESKLTLLSYHCHDMVPMGVSCVGVLLESHISFHTWPVEGVITLDLFTCGSGKLVPVLPIIEKLFAVPRAAEGGQQKPSMRWIHKLRGFRNEESKDYLSNDLGSLVLSAPEFIMKKEILAAQTTFQRVDIYDTLENRNEITERLLFLDGVMQSTRIGNEAYHEALVQPIMVTHPYPKRVAIIGGGEGATLREVLKHDYLEKVVMVEIDEELVKLSREYLPDWSDCSDIEGSSEWCGDDERAELYYEDALAWFNDRFSDVAKAAADKGDNDEPLFDVLIMDALDPQDDVPFADLLYSDFFMKTLYNALNDDGMIVLQLGGSSTTIDPADEHTTNAKRAELIESLERIGFENIHMYTESHCNFGSPWTFAVATKDKTSSQQWYRSAADIEISLHYKLRRSYSGSSVLKYFDGSQMSEYQLAHKAFETVFCRRDPTPKSCKMMSKRKNVPNSNLDVRLSTVGDGSGRGVFALVDIEEGAYIAAEEVVYPVQLSAVSTNYLLYVYSHVQSRIDSVFKYMDGYGWYLNDGSYMVDSSVMTFSNHGCNGTYNADDLSLLSRRGITEQNAKLTDYPKHNEDIYDPFRSRRLTSFNNQFQVAVKDIQAGDEILCDYLYFTLSSDDDFYRESQVLKRICNGEEVGLITKTENMLRDNGNAGIEE